MSNIQANNRLYHIDRMKVLGLLLVILAHVDLPNWLAQLRCFDVPLLVFVSAYLARRSYMNSDVASYYKKRLIRLAVPAWIFALFFWMVQSIALTPPSLNDIFKGLTFQRDTYMLGMLWVIWVYIVCAFMIPLVNKANCSIKIQAIVVLMLVIYQLFCDYSTLSEHRVLYCTIFTAIPYGFITYFGYFYCDLKAKNKIFLALGSAGIFCTMTLILWHKEGDIFPITEYKYPAQIYFLSYAIPIIFALFELLPLLDRYRPSCLVQFMSKSSLWIYLWHILILYAVKMLITDSSYWWIQYTLIIVISVFVTWIQNKVIDWLFAKYKWKPLMVFKG